MMLLHSVNAV